MLMKKLLCAFGIKREYNSARTGLARKVGSRIFELRRPADTHLCQRGHSAGDILRVRRRMRNIIRRPRWQVSGSGRPGHAAPLTYGRDFFSTFEEKGSLGEPPLSRGS